MSLCFLDKVHFKGGVKFSKILRGGGGVFGGGGGGGGGGVGLKDLEFFWEGLGKKGWRQYFRVGLISWRTLCSSFLKFSGVVKIHWLLRQKVRAQMFDKVLNTPLLEKYVGIVRSSHQRCSVRKGVLRNLAKFTGKHLCQSSLF